MIILTHTTAPLKTEVHIGYEFLYSPACLDLLRCYRGRIAIITDTQIKTLIGDQWVSFLRKQGLDASLFAFPCGEASKNRRTKELLEDEMIQARCGKDTLVIGLGGGVVTDLAGFLASTFLRGVSLMLIPTSLLGMVDAAIGGKTGVNTPCGKNLIGSFFPPEHLIIDPSTLSTLAEREWRNASAEIIKYGLIVSSSLFDKLIARSDEWHARSPEFIQELIYDSLLIKKQVIETDFHESGFRRILNFGHTIAHALEALEDYRLAHGEAVAIGLLVESTLSYRLGLLKEEELTQIEQILSLYQFPLEMSTHASYERILSHMKTDKKATAATPRFVLLERIGKAAPFDQVYCTEVPEPLLIEVLTEMFTKLQHTV